ncbi:DsbA family protein [Frigidibacter sp. ROC022]|uniref:DsbA family protein n=1 Tax=Frigidibacter sp. ROC022 TaxID=2971796 RepID=UPI00215AF71B|nr:DsbA family protein [Frigidibacter sp. ROC022]MCR8724331.1 DsbA family protein [Frigidibacter sp. ROC022]
MNRRALLGAVGVAAIAGGGWYFSRAKPGQTNFDLSASAEDAADIDTSMIPEMTLGNPDAKVTVTEYASFTCPHCRDFHDLVFKKLRKNYIDTGKIHFIYREVYFDRFGLWGAMLARCGGGLRYFGIADILYDTQTEWLAGGDPAKIAANLKKIGLQAGMTSEEIDTCMNDADGARALVALYQKNAAADGIDSTPSFLINGKKYSNMAYDEFSKLIDAELAKS